MEPIAIVGLAGRFPGADDLTRYWANLVARRSSVTEFTVEELVRAGVPEHVASHPDYVRAHPRLADFDMFDARLFGMNAREAELTDPQLRVFLEIAHAALQDAGYDPFATTDAVGVFAAAGPMTYGHRNLRDERSAGNESLFLMANNVDYLATQVSYRLNLTGPSVSVATACSSSLTAVHLALQALRVGDCDAAVAGGISIDLDELHGYWHVPGGIRSRSGRCAPLDASADGTVFGSGAGAVVLKRLTDAVADGDHVRAVIVGSAINNDGSDKLSFTAPSHTGQSRCVQDAFVSADVWPADIDYVEVHATATAIGDPIEIRALAEAWGSRDRPQPAPGSCPIGSVKSNIGHAGQAAGVAGLIKLVLSFDHELLPAMAGFSTPNPALELDSTPFHVPTGHLPWPAGQNRPRLAAISSFGVGGTNVHMIVGEPPERRVPTPAFGRPRAVVWSAFTADAAGELRADLADHFASRPETFEDSTTVLQRGRRHHPVRGAIVCADAAGAADALSGDGRVITATAPRGTVATTFLLPGQGALYPAAGIELYRDEPVFADAVDQCFALYGSEGARLQDAWLGASTDLKPTDVAQPVLFAIEYGLVRLWQSWGVVPDLLLGHSLGDLVAAAVAEVVPLADAVRLVRCRAEAMAAAAPGAMLAVLAPETTVRPLLADRLVIAAVNGPRETVVAGELDEVERFAERLSERDVRTKLLRTPHAFHSPAMAEAMARFEAAFDGVALKPPSIAIISAATGAAMSDEEAVDPRFWARQLVEPVLFADALDAVPADHVLVEVGPGDTLAALARARHRTAVACLAKPRHREPQRHVLMTAVATAWAHGVDVDWAEVDGFAPTRRTPVPGHRSDRERYWIDEPAAAPPASVEAAPTGPFTTVHWVRRSRQATDALPPSAAVVLLPSAADAAARAITACQQAGMRVHLVRPGTGFAEDDQGFDARPGNTEDLRQVFLALHRDGVRVGHLVHALALADWAPATSAAVDEQLTASFFALLALVQESGRHPALTSGARLNVLASRSVDVSGSEPVDLVKATLHGQHRTLAVEAVDLRPRLIDVGAGTPDAAVAEELRRPGDETVVALRGANRWVRVESAYEPEAGSPALRANGVYLVTGGFGGLGLVVAEGIARTGLRPTLVLLGRHLGRAGEAEAVERLTALGAEVRGIAADLGDPAAVRAALHEVRSEFGPVTGVFHLAGVAGDGMLALRDPDLAADVLRPKVLGTLLLKELLLDGARAPEFFVAFASRAGVDGLAGSGDYAAANAFLDGFAAKASSERTRVLSIDWPAWARVGMAASPDAGLADGEQAVETVLDPATTWQLDEHRIGGNAVLPGTAHLDAVVRAARSRLAMTGPITLTGVVFQAPLVVGTVARTRIVFTPDATGWRVRTESFSPRAWRTHLTGHIAASPDVAPRTVDLDAVRSELTEAAGPDLTDSAFRFGPRWHNITSVHRGGEERLLGLELPAPFADDLGEHPLHPALLDNATAGTRDAGEHTALPFAYGRLVLHQDLPAHVYSHIRRRAGSGGTIRADIDVVGPDGAVLVEIEDFAMYPASAEELGGAERACAPGIDPDMGVAMLMALLDATTPPQVVVRPHHDGLPVPVGAPVRPVPAASAPAAPVEEPVGDDVAERIRLMWRQVLGSADVDEREDFFEAGGSSLAAIELMTRIRDEFHIELSIALLLDAPTLGDFVAAVTEHVDR